jgi:hypothetical protein
VVEAGLELAAINAATERIATTNPRTMPVNASLRKSNIRVISIALQFTAPDISWWFDSTAVVTEALQPPDSL